jgi:hypothetical protein
MRKIWIAFLMMVPCLFVQGGENNCQEVGGAVLTNFLSTPAPGANTLGTATGELRGGLGVTILTVTPPIPGPGQTVVFHVQHHWVTEAGDTIFLDPADVTAFPTTINGLFAASYINGVTITGGTGRFAGAHGTLTVFGAVDLSQDFGHIILRYQGNICFAKPKD